MVWGILSARFANILARIRSGGALAARPDRELTDRKQHERARSGSDPNLFSAGHALGKQHPPDKRGHDKPELCDRDENARVTDQQPMQQKNKADDQQRRGGARIAPDLRRGVQPAVNYENERRGKRAENPRLRA